MDSIFKGHFLEHYNNLIKQLLFSYPNHINELNELNLLSDDDKYNKGLLFNSMLDDETLSLFVESKIKVFSHKSEITMKLSESLLSKPLALKYILNGQTDEFKKNIWAFLHNIVLSLELSKPKEEQNNKLITALITVPADIETSFNNLLGDDVNDDTKAMIDDIVKSFKNIFKGHSMNIKSIMEITKKIAFKYSDKIKSGNIEINKLMQTAMSKLPGMDKFKDKFGDVMNGLFDKDILSSNKTKDDEVIIVDENFSTSQVKVSEPKKKNLSGPKIGDIIQMADSFGMMSLPKSGTTTTTNESGGSFDINNIMNIMNKLKTQDGSGNIDLKDIENDMNNMLKSAGLDMNDMKKDLNNMLNNTTQSNE